MDFQYSPIENFRNRRIRICYRFDEIALTWAYAVFNFKVNFGKGVPLVLLVTLTLRFVLKVEDKSVPVSIVK